MDLNDLDIKPKIQKSNLNISSNRKRRKKVNEGLKSRLKKEEETIKDFDVIFGLDNGATRNNFLHYSI